jgi:hypothetical protein
MGLSYEKNKIHIYKWRENNKEKKKELDRKHQMNRYNWIQETKRLRNILINE